MSNFDPYRAYRESTCVSVTCPYREIVHTHTTGQPVVQQTHSTAMLLEQIQPWLNEVGREHMRIRYRLDQIVHDLQVEIATLQEQIDELWAEVRGE